MYQFPNSFIVWQAKLMLMMKELMHVLMNVTSPSSQLKTICRAVIPFSCSTTSMSLVMEVFLVFVSVKGGSTATVSLAASAYDLEGKLRVILLLNIGLFKILNDYNTHISYIYYLRTKYLT